MLYNLDEDESEKVEKAEEFEFWNSRILPSGLIEDLEVYKSELYERMATLVPDQSEPNIFMTNFTILQSEISIINKILDGSEEASDNVKIISENINE